MNFDFEISRVDCICPKQQPFQIRGPRDEDEGEENSDVKTTTTKAPRNEKAAAEEIENTYKKKLSFRCDGLFLHLIKLRDRRGFILAHRLYLFTDI